MDWFPDWSGQTAVVAGAGPSATQQDLDLCRGARVIAVNSSWKLAPWADAVYASDQDWWRRARPDAFAGLRVAPALCLRHDPAIKTVVVRKDDNIVTVPPGVLGSGGGHGGFQALNLAIQFGARRIILIGIDCRIDQGLHWHGPHPKGLGNPRDGAVKQWRFILDGQAKRLKNLGVEVVNASPISALTAFPRMTMATAMRNWS